MIVRKKMEQGRLNDLMVLKDSKELADSQGRGPRTSIREDIA